MGGNGNKEQEITVDQTPHIGAPINDSCTDDARPKRHARSSSALTDHRPGPPFAARPTSALFLSRPPSLVQTVFARRSVARRANEREKGAPAGGFRQR